MHAGRRTGRHRRSRLPRIQREVRRAHRHADLVLTILLTSGRFGWLRADLNRRPWAYELRARIPTATYRAILRTTPPTTTKGF